MATVEAGKATAVPDTERDPNYGQGKEMDQEKKDSQAPDHSSKDEKQDQKQGGNSSNPQNEQGNKEKE